VQRAAAHTNDTAVEELQGHIKGVIAAVEEAVMAAPAAVKTVTATDVAKVLKPAAAVAAGVQQNH
jgi:hypothetical protein